MPLLGVGSTGVLAGRPGQQGAQTEVVGRTADPAVSEVAEVGLLGLAERMRG